MSRRRTFLAFLILLGLASPVRVAWSSEQEKLSLFNALEEALKHHPDIAVVNSRVAQAQARSSQSPSIPPPILSVGVMGENGPLNSQGRMENSIEVSQTIPFPTKLTAESRARGADERAAEEELRAKTLEIRAEVKTAFFDLYRARQQIGLLAEKKQVLLEHVKRVRATSISDRLAQVHLLRVQTDALTAENEIDRARPDETTARGRLNIALGQEPASPIPQLELPPLSELPRENSTQIQAEHPAIRTLHAQVEASEAESDRAHSAWLPDFRVQYRSSRRFDGVMPNNSELMVGIDLPFLFFWQPKGQAAEGTARLAEVRASLTKSQADLNLKKLKARADAEALRSQVLRFEREILPQAQKRLKIAHGIAPSDMESLDEHRGAMESLIELKRTALDLHVNYEKAAAELESLSPAQEVRP